MLSFRLFEKGDEVRVSEMITETLSRGYLNLPKEDPIYEEVAPSKILNQSSEMNLLILERNSQIVAVGGLKPDGEIKTIYVDYSSQGKGYGKRVISELENLAIDSGLDVIFLNSFPGKSENFYNKIGYTKNKKISKTYFFKKL